MIKLRELWKLSDISKIQYQWKVVLSAMRHNHTRYGDMPYLLRDWLCCENLIPSHSKQPNTSSYSTKSQYHQVVGWGEIGIKEGIRNSSTQKKQNPTSLSREMGSGIFSTASLWLGLTVPTWRKTNTFFLKMKPLFGR